MPTKRRTGVERAPVLVSFRRLDETFHSREAALVIGVSGVG